MIVFLPAYTAPEQIAAPGTTGSVWGQISTSWAASCELLTGAPAFRDNGMHDQNSSILEDTQVISRWNCRHGNELEKIILRCLAKSRKTGLLRSPA